MIIPAAAYSDAPQPLAQPAAPRSLVPAVQSSDAAGQAVSVPAERAPVEPGRQDPVAAPTAALNLAPGLTGAIAPDVGQVEAPAPVFVPVLSAQPVPADLPAARSRWTVSGQTTLQATLQTWAETAGWTVYYETPTQYELPAAAELEGSFEEASARLIHLLRHRRPVPLLSLHPANRSLAVRSFASGGANQ